jgi:5'-nucleotidase
MKRRNFISNTAASSAFIGMGGLSMNSCDRFTNKHITILHTNDVHSHIDPFPGSHQAFPNLGGIARRASLIQKIRNENPNTLLFDAGDIFQGTPYFNFYGGELEFKLMSLLNYDAATIGNHDFDNGVDGLLAQMPYAKFSMLSANYDFSNTSLDGFVEPFKVYTLDAIKIGVFGLGIQLDGLVIPHLYKETVYQDPIERAQDICEILKNEHLCDVIICLSHLGFEYKDEPQRISDVKLAAATHNIDLIIGGHTHTFLEKPEVRSNRNGERVMINQVGCYGINLGRIDLYFDTDNKLTADGISIEV